MKKQKGGIPPFSVEFNGSIARSLATMIEALAEILEELKNLIVRRLRRL
jgi:hypothetical protein